jgi:hypothetical protein
MGETVKPQFELPPFQKELDEFLAPWFEHPNTEGALLVGSYAVGLQDDRSDVDVCIILNDDSSHWGRGNVQKGKYLIEYAFFTLAGLKQMQERDLVSRKRLRTRMIATGKVYFDKHGVLARLKAEAMEKLSEPMPESSEFDLEVRKYNLWDQLDNLKSLEAKQSLGYAYAYYAALQDIIEAYALHLGIELPRPGRMWCFLNEDDFRTKYRILEFPDRDFIAAFSSAMTHPSTATLETLTKHVHEKTGGFDVDGWNLIQPVQ